MIGRVRRESSTVVALAGEVHEVVLPELARSPNVSVVRADSQGSADETLRRAARRMTPFVLVASDPLADVAAAWQAMWDLSATALGGAAFEERAAEARTAWHAGRFELPDYYLVLTRPLAVPGDSGHGVRGGPGLHLGPLRSACPHRVEVVVLPGRDGQDAPGTQGTQAGQVTGRPAVAFGPAGADGPEQAARVLDALRSLRHGPWWPPLDELIEAARHFYAGGLGEPGA